MPGRVYIDAEVIPVLDEVSPKAPERAVADYSAVVSLGGHLGVYQDLSKQDLEVTTLASPTVCGSSTGPNQQVCLPGVSFRISDNPS